MLQLSEEPSRQLHAPRAVVLERIVEETPSIRSFWFNDASLHDSKPGQFAMVWIPGVDEVPMSVLAVQGEAEAGVVIKKGGPVSVALWQKKPGDELWVRGPYGNPNSCLLYTSPSPRALSTSRMPSSA